MNVFVLCPSYHGATLLALLLGEHRDIVDLGDTNPAIDGGTYCRCGLTVATCGFWKDLRAAVDPPLVAGDSHWFPRCPPYTRFGRLNGPLTLGLAALGAATHGRVRPTIGDGLERYQRGQMALSQAAMRATGARVFVDGEKSAEKAAYLGTTGSPVRIIHLVRDPRGFALSARSRAARAGRVVASTTYASDWRRYHAKVRLVRRLVGESNVIVIRYEDLATETSRSRARILQFLGVPPLSPETRRPQEAAIHAIGNKLLKSFDGSIELDERWRSELDPHEAREILRRSGGFAAEHGYRDTVDEGAGG